MLYFPKENPKDGYNSKSVFTKGWSIITSDLKKAIQENPIHLKPNLLLLSLTTEKKVCCEKKHLFFLYPAKMAPTHRGVFQSPADFITFRSIVSWNKSDFMFE